MSRAAEPELEPGRVYRTRELRRWSANPPRLADRLVREGKLHRASHGIYYAPAQTRFGPAPPQESEVLRVFLQGGPFIFSGPPKWNPLGLGTTAMFAASLVYNTKRTGEFILGRRRFLLRRVLFPRNPPPEYYVVDLLEHHDMAGISLPDLERGLVSTLRQDKWDVRILHAMAERFGTKLTLSRVEKALQTVDGVS